MVYTDNIPENYEDDHDFDPQGLNTAHVQQAMEELPEGYRIVFSLFLLEGYDHSEIGQILGISESTSKSQYSRARQKIQEILIQKGYGKQV